MDTDFVERSFSEKVKAIRLFYCLTFRETAKLLHYKSPANISFMEKVPMVNKPSFSLLIAMQQLYGLSLDWLMGMDAAPFTKASLESAESGLEDKLTGLSLDFPMNQFPTVSLLQQVMKEIVRDRQYCHLCDADRFVLLFLLQYLDWIFHEIYDGYHEGKKMKDYFYIDSTQELRLKKHREYIPALFQLKEGLKEKQVGSVLCASWNFLSYAHRLNLL